MRFNASRNRVNIPAGNVLVTFLSVENLQTSRLATGRPRDIAEDRQLKD
jgi:hypothetical protein